MKRWMRLGLMGLTLAGAGTGCRALSPAWWKSKPTPVASAAAVATPPAAPAEDVSEAPTRYVRRVHLRFRNEQETGEYVAAAARKREALENYRALRRLLMEKAVEAKTINATLEQEYKLKTGTRYEYDEPSKTILEVVEDGKGGVIRKEALKLADPVVEEKVARLLGARNRTREEASALQAGMARQEADLIQIQNALAQEYGVSRDREYTLDSKTRTLWERVPVPKRFEVEGEKE